MLYIKSLLVTSLLVLLLYSGYGLYIAITVFLITIVVTYVCFTLNTQLRLEEWIALLIRYGREVANPTSPTDPCKKYDGITSLPRPFTNIFRKYIDSIVNDFIATWYVAIGPNEKDFIKEVRFVLESIVVEVFVQLHSVDIHNLTINLIHLFQRHIKVFDNCRSIVRDKYSGINDEDLCICITELYEFRHSKHIATRSKGTEIDYFKALLDIFLYKFLPANAFSCEGGSFMLREILTTQLLEPLVKDLTDAHFVNTTLLDILEPSLPLSVVLHQWQKAMEEEEIISDDVSLSEQEDEASTLEVTQHESSPEPEEHKCKPNVDHQLSRRRSRQNTYYHDMDKFDDELIRFDKLDLRTSAPVYGSVSARDHEKFKKKNNKTKNTATANLLTSDPANRNLMTDNDDTFSMLSQEKSTGESYLTYHSSASKITAWPSSWTVCPSSDASLFRHSSFIEMPRKQDHLAEKVKAKFGHVDLTDLKQMNWLHNTFPQISQGGNDDMQKPTEMSDCSTLKVDDTAVTYDILTTSEDAVAELISNLQGTPDEDGNPCPICIEMTFMASPFELDKQKVIINSKKQVSEHACGLNCKHYHFSETDTEANNEEPFDDASFASCEDLGDDNLSSSSSNTYLASNETDSISSKKIETYDIVSSHSGNWSREDDSSSLSYDDVEEFPSDNESIVSGNSCTNIFQSSKLTFKSASENSFSSNKNTFVKGANGDIRNSNHRQKNGKSHVEYNSKYLKRNKSKSKFFKFFKGFAPLPRGNLIKRKRTKTKSRRNFLRNKNRNNLLESSLSTCHTKFKSLPENPASVLSPQSDVCPDIREYDVEEALDALEDIDDEEYLEFPDYQLYNNGNRSVDPLSKVIAVNEKDSVGSQSPNVTRRAPKNALSASKVSKNATSSENGETTTFLPMFQGEVIMPHPSKIPAAWLYPIQMLSIPSTETNYEKGWEPGTNKYTLYRIHYDIRIWPDVYQKSVVDARSHSQSGENAEEGTVPLIREIKRRYREFLYLHNRFTHGPLSKHMKGILRPNRRYAMPFGRMDPDVIEGRRRILETYLVSVVSRPELCNSREFKEFLGSEDHQDAVKPTMVAQKQVNNTQMDKLMVSVKGTEGQSLQVHKDHVDKLNGGLNSQYFIHGYEVPRMFGYADIYDVKRNSSMLFDYFVENDLPSQDSHHSLKESRGYRRFSFIPPSMSFSSSDGGDLKDIASLYGRRTSADGAEIPNALSPETKLAGKIDDVVKKTVNGTLSSIAAKFSPELASQLEKENLELSIAHEKSLYESSWPITDAALSIVCQLLKGYESWLSFEKVQQAILFSVGGLVEWLIKRKLDEVTRQEKCYQYVSMFYDVLWNEKGVLKEKNPDPTAKERADTKEEALTRLKEVIPCFLMMSIGPDNYKKCCEDILHTLQYQATNRHLLFGALEIILFELIPELRNGFPEYLDATTLFGKIV